MLQLQMTGYMLRNAEYVMALRQVLQLQTRSSAEFRTTFDRIDLDKSGYIETAEIEELLSDIYKGEVPAHEVSTFLSLFDTDGDGRIRCVPSVRGARQRVPTIAKPLKTNHRVSNFVLAAGRSLRLLWAPPRRSSFLATCCHNSTPTATSAPRHLW